MTLRIIVHEPNDWKDGNLFREIVSERKGVIQVRTSRSITGRRITSDLIEFKPLRENETFSQLLQYASVFGVGELIDKQTGTRDLHIMGTLTTD